MKKLLSIFALLLALAFLPSSLGLRLRIEGRVTIYSAPSWNSTVLRSVNTIDLTIICQKEGWSQVTGYAKGAGKYGFVFIKGGKQIKGVPTCSGLPLQTYDQGPNPLFAYPIPPEVPISGYPIPASPPNLLPALGAPCSVPPSRQGIAMAAMWAARNKQNITYSQNASRWSGINQKVCPHLKVPPFADSSSFATWLFWTAFGDDRDFLHNQNWKGGNIETMRNNSFPISLSGARPGDVVFYGSKAPHDHVAVYVGNGQVVTFETNGPAKTLPISHCGNDYIVRSYLP